MPSTSIITKVRLFIGFLFGTLLVFFGWLAYELFFVHHPCEAGHPYVSRNGILMCPNILNTDRATLVVEQRDDNYHVRCICE